MKRSYFLTGIALIWGVCVFLFIQNRRLHSSLKLPMVLIPSKSLGIAKDSVVGRYNLDVFNDATKKNNEDPLGILKPRNVDSIVH